MAAPIGASVISEASDPEGLMVDRICATARLNTGDVTELVTAEVARVAPLADDSERQRLIDRALARLDGLGIVDDLLLDPTVDEIMINAGRDVWVDRGGQLVWTGSLPPGTVEGLLERALAPLGRRLDRTSPIVDARLPNGARLCAIVPPVAVDGCCVTVRRHRDSGRSLDDFANPATVAVIEELIETRANILIAGATSSGKTSLLGAMLDRVDPADRLLVIEDTAELPIRLSNGARLEARPATADQTQPVSMDDLVVAALRLRPDRLIIGEFRGTEVRAVVQALNTGHDGSLCTCHANSASDGLRRVETLLLQAAPGWPLPAIRRQVSRSIDAVIFVERHPNGVRLVREIGEVVESDGEPQLRVLASGGSILDSFTRGRAR